MPYPSNPAVHLGGNANSPATLSSLPSDLLTRILHLLDGPSLAAISCTSSHLRALSSDPALWRRLCRATWPSSNHPRVSCIVSAAFPSAHRSFFSDAFPLLPLHPLPPRLPSPPHQLVSAVDLRHRSAPVFSALVETETRTGWFFSSPFRVDALDRKDPSPPAAAALSADSLAADLTLSWIVIDPARGRAANVASLRPVSVQRHWFSGEIQARFAAVLETERAGEWAACSVVVACGERGEKGRGLQVREVSMVVEDMDGMSLNGRDSLVILQGAMEGKRAALGGRDMEEVMRERYSEFLERKKERKEKKMRREGRLDLACILMGVSVFASFLGWIFSRG
ncbi:hypothetical protein ACLOJK_020798 [Asimina triloba]